MLCAEQIIHLVRPAAEGFYASEHDGLGSPFRGKRSVAPAASDWPTDAHDRRARARQVIWWLRGCVAAFVFAYLLLPYSLTAHVPVWLPFLCALVVEAQFFFGGRRRPAHPRQSGSGPQEHDLVELSEWVDLELPQGGTLQVGAGELTRRELAAWLALHEAEFGELAPGDYEVGPLRLVDGPEARPRQIVDAGSPDLPSRRARSRHLATAVVLAVLAALLFLVPWRPGSWDRLSETKRASAEALYSQIASSLAGHRAHVHCDSSGRHVGVIQDADGLAVVGGDQAWLTPGTCYALYQARTGAIPPDSAEAGRAIAVLAHEAWHLRGEASEALANCYGYQSGVAVGVALGLAPHTARRLMRGQLAANAVDYADAPAYLVPGGCRNGGPYDLHPASPAFP
jgi:hypothetical protein